MTTNYNTFSEVSNFNLSLLSDNALLVVKAEQSLIQLSWMSSPTATELTACATVVSELIKENNIAFFLHDIRNVNFSDINIHRCLAKAFCPQILEAGIKRFVHLAKYELPELLILDEITTYIQTKVIKSKAIKMETCTTPEGAFDWINNSGINTTLSAQTVAKEVTVEQVGYEWTAAAQVSSSLKQYKEKAAMVFRILVKRRSFYSEI